MLKAILTNQFKRDLKRVKKRGYQMEKLASVSDLIEHEKALPRKYHDHVLKGNWVGHRECHMAPDWLLIYRILPQEGLVYYVRTGSHADLFDE